MSTLAKIEALLFVAGEDGIRVRQLAELLSATDRHPAKFRKISPEVWKGPRFQFGFDWDKWCL